MRLQYFMLCIYTKQGSVTFQIIIPHVSFV